MANESQERKLSAMKMGDRIAMYGKLSKQGAFETLSENEENTELYHIPNHTTRLEDLEQTEIDEEREIKKGQMTLEDLAVMNTEELQSLLKCSYKVAKKIQEDALIVSGSSEEKISKEKEKENPQALSDYEMMARLMLRSGGAKDSLEKLTIKAGR